MELSDPEEEIAPPPVKKHITENNLNATLIAGRNLRERKNNEDEQTPLQKCLDYLHNILVKWVVLKASRKQFNIIRAWDLWKIMVHSSGFCIIYSQAWVSKLAL